jgi:spore coat polysaccharide biosynthesis protein SpsF
MQIIIQARLNSSRLPKKVLHEIKGKPLLGYLMMNLKRLDDHKIYIATSDKSSDNDIENYCEKNNILCFRGSLNDVAKRMLDTAKYYNADAFVRINGDSPIMDPKIVERGIEIYENGEYDLVTNTYSRSFPVGQSVEVIRTSTFKKAYQNMFTTDHFEHVTKYYYEHADKFHIKNFSNDRDLSHYRLVVDTPEDLKRMQKIIGSMTRPHTEYGLDDLIELYPSA